MNAQLSIYCILMMIGPGDPLNPRISSMTNTQYSVPRMHRNALLQDSRLEKFQKLWHAGQLRPFAAVQMSRDGLKSKDARTEAKVISRGVYDFPISFR